MIGAAYSRHPEPIPAIDRNIIMASEYDHPVRATAERARKFAEAYRATGGAYAERGDFRAAGVCEDAAGDFERLARVAETAMKGARL